MIKLKLKRRELLETTLKYRSGWHEHETICSHKCIIFSSK